MRAEESLKTQWQTYEARRDYWRAKNRFYHRYVERLVGFLVPEGVRVYTVTHPLTPFVGTEGQYDYIVASDMLGHVFDVQSFFEEAERHLAPGGRIVVTQYSALWEPVLRLASLLRLRSPSVEQNWISPGDIRTFFALAGLERLKAGQKLLMPKYLPLISAFFNTILANLWPFSHLGLVHFAVARRAHEPSSAPNPSLSVVVPARNEAGTIERIIKELPAVGAFTEIIFIEGNSNDDTRAVIERAVASYGGEKRLKCAVQEGKGKGDAVRTGFAMAEGDMLAIYDADMTVPARDVEKFYRALVERRGDFANGSRLVYPVEAGAMRFANIVANKFFSLAFTWILGQPIKDTLCGTKALWKKDYETIKKNRAFFGDFDPFGDFDLLFGAAKLNLKIIEIPVRYRDRVYGSTNISRWRHGVLLLNMTLFAARKLLFW